MYIGQLDKSIKVEVNSAPDIYIPSFEKIIARSRNGLVYLIIDNKAIEMNTLTAHKIGYTMAMAVPKLSPHELISLIINGESIDMLKLTAKKVSAALLRKADDADDWQLLHRRLN